MSILLIGSTSRSEKCPALPFPGTGRASCVLLMDASLSSALQPAKPRSSGLFAACSTVFAHFGTRHHAGQQIEQARNVCYDIRGPVLKHAKRLEEEGHRILKLNIGNPAPFGFKLPRKSSRTSSATCRPPRATATPRVCSARAKAVMQYTRRRWRRRHRGHLPRQRRVGTDRDIHAGAAEQRRRVLIPLPTTAVDRRGQPRRRQTGCTTCATSRPTGGRTSKTSRRRSRRTPGRW